MEAAAKEMRDRIGERKPAIVAVTVLTSLDQHSLSEIGIEQTIDEQVRRLALLAQDSGIDGVVCSPHEISMIREIVEPAFQIVVPGIRMAGQSLHDQQRAATPHDAIAAGADYIVVGRAVTENEDPHAALERLIQTL